ncbi:MAG: MBL fold metallo-hydrolase [Treponema sp.]|nr:MBL fold metallo-hydrolase [Treponema sp.]
MSEILRLARPEDLADKKSRERFIAALPSWLCGTFGGNTPCVSLEDDGFDESIVFDCGSGMRGLGLSPASRRSKYHVFFSHFHFDHLQGLPFFAPAYDPAVSVNFYSPNPGLKDCLSKLLSSPYSPVTLREMPAAKRFVVLEGPLSLGPFDLSYQKLSHPDQCFAYKARRGDRSVIYATDTELKRNDLAPGKKSEAFFRGADVLILDAQYTPTEALQRRNWGHSSYDLAVDFAALWGVKRLIFFHHDPDSDDDKLRKTLSSARKRAKAIGCKGMEISLAEEGLEITL